jgi:hypothetical protein
VPFEVNRATKRPFFASSLSVNQAELLYRSRMKAAAARVQV